MSQYARSGYLTYVQPLRRRGNLRSRANGAGVLSVAALIGLSARLLALLGLGGRLFVAHALSVKYFFEGTSRTTGFSMCTLVENFSPWALPGS